MFEMNFVHSKDVQKKWARMLLIGINIRVYIITQVIVAFLLVLAYDLLEDRCTIDVIITQFSPLPF